MIESWKYLGDLRGREGPTIHMTTHDVDKAEHSDRIAIIDHCEIVAVDTPTGLKRARSSSGGRRSPTSSFVHS